MIKKIQTKKRVRIGPLMMNKSLLLDEKALFMLLKLLEEYEPFSFATLLSISNTTKDRTLTLLDKLEKKQLIHIERGEDHE